MSRVEVQAGRHWRFAFALALQNKGKKRFSCVSHCASGWILIIFYFFFIFFFLLFFLLVLSWQTTRTQEPHTVCMYVLHCCSRYSYEGYGSVKIGRSRTLFDSRTLIPSPSSSNVYRWGTVAESVR